MTGFAAQNGCMLLPGPHVLGSNMSLPVSRVIDGAGLSYTVRSACNINAASI